MRALDAVITWDATRRPADEGAWAGAELLNKRPAVDHAAGWEYLNRGALPVEQQAPSLLCSLHYCRSCLWPVFPAL